MTKALIFDSGALISLAMNGLLGLLEKLKKNFKGKFLITREIKYEVVDRPIGIFRFELEALQIQNLIDEGILEMPSSLGIQDEIIKKKTTEIMEIANRSVQVGDRWVNIVSEGEMSCLALSNELKRRDIESLISIDERTTRIMCENPQNLESLISEKLHQKVELVARNYNVFSQFKFIRSSELVFVAFKKGIINLEGKKVLEALLYATKYKGCSISLEEIDILKKL